MITLTEAQNSVLRAITNDGEANYWQGYRYILSLLDDGDPNNQGAYFWLDKASEINANANDSEGNIYIRAVTRAGFEFDGTNSSEDRIQANSDAIGRAVILEDVLNKGEFPSVESIIARDALVAVQEGGQTLGGWGGSFYYWDVPFGDEGRTTVGEEILNDPLEYDKFIAVTARATAEVIDKFGITIEQFLAASTVNGEVLAAVNTRIYEVIVEGDNGFAGNPYNIDGYRPVLSEDETVTAWLYNTEDEFNVLLTDEIKIAELNARFEVRFRLSEDPNFQWIQPKDGSDVRNALDIMDNQVWVLNEIAETAPMSLAALEAGQIELAKIGSWYASQIAETEGEGKQVNGKPVGILDLDKDQGILKIDFPGELENVISTVGVSDDADPRLFAFNLVNIALSPDDTQPIDQIQELNAAIEEIWGADGDLVSYAANKIKHYMIEANSDNGAATLVAENEDSTVLIGGEKSDALTGNSDDDILVGRDGNDVLTGDSGSDILLGGADNDILIGGTDEDVLVGGADDDILVAGDMALGESSELSLTHASLAAAEDTDNDQLFGGEGADQIVSTGGRDLLVGGAGDDKFYAYTPSYNYNQMEEIEATNGSELGTLIWGGEGADEYHFFSSIGGSVDDFKVPKIAVIQIDGLTGSEWPEVDLDKLHTSIKEYLTFGSGVQYTHVLINPDEEDSLFVDGVQVTGGAVAPSGVENDGRIEIDDFTRFGYDDEDGNFVTNWVGVDDSRSIVSEYDVNAAYLGSGNRFWVAGYHEYGDDDLMIDRYGGGEIGYNPNGGEITYNFFNAYDVQSKEESFSLSGFTNGMFGINFGTNPKQIIKHTTYTYNKFTLDPAQFDAFRKGALGYGTEPLSWVEEWREMEVVGTDVDTDDEQYLLGEDYLNATTFTFNIEDFLNDSDPVDETGTDGADNMIGGEGDDRLSGEDGDDELSGNGGNDRLNGGDGDDRLDGGSGNDELYGGAGDDRVYGGSGDDLIIGGTGQGNDIYDGGAGTDTLVFPSTSQGVTVNLELGFAEGTEIDRDVLISIENVVGGTGNDTIIGDDQNNSLSGSAGADELSGLGGDDRLEGGAGSDRFIYRLGDGSDTIVDMELSADRLDMSATGLNYFEVLARASNQGSDVVIDLSDVEGASASDSLTLLNTSVEQLTPSSFILTAPEVSNEVSDQTATEGEEWSFTIPADTFSDADGDALTYTATLDDGSALPDWLSFDAATRTFTGTPPEGFEGDLSLTVTVNDGYETAFDTFDVTINDAVTLPTPTYVGTDNDDGVVWLTPGDDVIDTGAGDEYVNAGGGNDTFLWRKGDGNDSFGAGGNAENTTDIVIFADVASTEVTYGTSEGKNITITVTSTGEVVTLADQLGGFEEKFSEVRFADGVVLNFAELSDLAGPAFTYVGTDEADGAVWTTSNDDVITSGGGDDYVNGGDGSDTIYWYKGDGNDAFGAGWNAENTTDVVIFADVASTDVTYGTSEGKHITITVTSTGEVVTLADQLGGFEEKFSEVRFADGVVLSFAELSDLAGPAFTYVGTDEADGAVWTTSNDDLITSGGGDDYVNGGDGSDTIYWYKGDGNDAFGAGWNAENTTDVVIFADVASTDVTYGTSEGKNITITVTSTGEVVTLADQLGGFEEKFSEVRFADGVTLSFAELADLAGPAFTYVGTDEADGAVWTTSNDDVITSGGGDDYVNGGDGSDTIYWYKGDGNDAFGAGWNAENTTDVVIFADVASTDVTYGTSEGKHITITVTSTGEVIELSDQIGGFEERFDEIRFSDGASLNFDEFTSAAGYLDTVSDSSDIGDTIAGAQQVGNARVIEGVLEQSGDQDWFAINLQAGDSFQFNLQGAPSGSGTLSDPFLYLRDGDGNEIASNDDGGHDLESLIQFTATETGTYYLDVAAYEDAAGTYRLNITDWDNVA